MKFLFHYITSILFLKCLCQFKITQYHKTFYSRDFQTISYFGYWMTLKVILFLKWNKCAQYKIQKSDVSLSGGYALCHAAKWKIYLCLNILDFATLIVLSEVRDVIYGVQSFIHSFNKSLLSIYSTLWGIVLAVVHKTIGKMLTLPSRIMQLGKERECTHMFMLNTACYYWCK